MPGSLNNYIPARLNCVFKVCISWPEGETVYRLAYIMQSAVVGGQTAKNDKGILRVRFTDPPKNVVVRAANIAGMAHLIPVEPNTLWYINNRIDLHT